MIKSIQFNHYRKLENLTIEPSMHLNAISGTNGTCKTSILHLISNSFKSVTATSPWIKDKTCLQIMNAVNSEMNPKVETLTRGDIEYNDPAHGTSGVLFTVNYLDDSSLGFRRHNSKAESRYAIKPQYKRGTHDSLPACPVVYLGLSRLLPYGEFKDDDSIKKLKNSLPHSYQDEIAHIYESFTHYKIQAKTIQQMGDVKTRSEFTSDKTGIDSNTISAGEDNLYIILMALISLKYYYESIDSTRSVESLLLVDELDATLHPAYQIKLLHLLREYSEKYKIQIYFTTHSMTMLEEMLKSKGKDKVFYFIDNVNNVHLMDEPDIYKIKMHLNSLTKEDIYLDKVIPVFSEDNEARFLIEMLLEYFEEKKPEFKGVKRFFHLIKVNMGAENLKSLFDDFKTLRSTMKAICILDGDHTGISNNNIIALPGHNQDSKVSGLSPEKLLFEYADILFEKDSKFWTSDLLIDNGYSKSYYLDKISDPICKYRNKLKKCAELDKKRNILLMENNLEEAAEIETQIKETKPAEREREFNKRIFNENRIFFEFLFKQWLNDESNRSIKYKFYTDLYRLFKKNALYNGINPEEWNDAGCNIQR